MIIGDNGGGCASTRSIAENIGTTLCHWSGPSIHFLFVRLLIELSDVMMVSAFAASPGPLGQIYPRFLRLPHCHTVARYIRNEGLCIRGKNSLM